MSPEQQETQADSIDEEKLNELVETSLLRDPE
jgi:hypothetical protein